jgi:hypothetical protein
LFRPVLSENAVLCIDYLGGVAEACDATDLPTFSQRAPIAPDVRGSKRYILASMLLTTIDRAVEHRYRVLTERRLAATVLAIRLYEIDKGRRPETLDQLVPDYLPAVPLDPMVAGGQPLRYRADATRPVVYSVGKNGVDDGGKPFDRPTDPEERQINEWDYPDRVVDLVRQPRTPPEKPKDVETDDKDA